MKNILLIFLCLIPVTLLSQCPNGDINLSSQAEIDAFPTTYPGCNELNAGLTISGNVIDLAPLSSISIVHGTLEIYNTSLADLSGLDGLIEIGGLAIGGNNNLVNLSGLDNLESICQDQGQTDLHIQDNDILTSVEALINASNICVENININNNTALTNLSGLENVDAFGQISISNNEALLNLDGLSGVTSVYSLYIWNNYSLESITGMSSLTSVSHDFYIGEAPNLLEINFASPVAVSDLFLDGLSNLESLSGFTANSDPMIMMIDNPMLSNITPFGYGEFAPYRFYIENNDSLTDLSFMAGIDVIEGFEIIDNDGLISFNGIDASSFYPGIDVIFKYNDVLSDISGLASTDMLEINQLEISNNPLLSVCDEESICSYLIGDGNAIIENNNEGCNTIQEVIDNCLLSVKSSLPEDIALIYPVPVRDILTISISEGNQFKKAILHSISGAELLSTAEKSIDVSSLSGGIYFIIVESDSGSITQKIVKE
jgi:hypothetical protein